MQSWLIIDFPFVSGLSQLALLINLVQVHGANVEAHDQDGMTPLCLAAKYDMDVIAEVRFEPGTLLNRTIVALCYYT